MHVGATNAELALLVGVLAAGTLPVLVGVLRARSYLIAVPAVALWAGVPTALAWTVTRYRPVEPTMVEAHDRPIEVPTASYVTSQTCKACHPAHYDTWNGSYHRSMTQAASPTSVVGDFENVTLTLRNRSYRLYRNGDEFWVDMEDPDWDESHGAAPRVQRKIVMTTGSHALQIYWFATGYGREIAQLPFDYRIQEQQWISDHGSFIRPPWPDGHNLPIAGAARWDVGCISCHATLGRPRTADEHRPLSDTHVAELGIACEACHGPAEQHVRINQSPARRYRQHLGDDADPTIVQPEKLPHQRKSQVCGQCHSVFTLRTDEEQDAWMENGYRYRPGDDLNDTKYIVSGRPAQNASVKEAIKENPSTRNLKESFWSDGMIRVSGREYNGLIESPCYLRGTLSCFSCHAMHQKPDDPRPQGEWANDQLKHTALGNEACLQCHDSFRSRIQEHTHHAAESTGSLCYNCHMPYTTYGLHKAIRSHQIDSPSVAASQDTGRPNACNQCHLDRTLDWTSRFLETWFDIAPPTLDADEQHVAASLLWGLRGDPGQRALMAWSMGWDAAQEASGTRWIPPYLGHLLMDPYDAVRFIAYRSLQTLPDYESVDYGFLAPPEERMSAARSVSQLWMHTSSAGAARAGMDAVLIGPDGRLQINQIMRLTHQRDDKPFLLRE